jgi:glycosyltransferase involved in cell wall biosynthesis
MEKAYTHNILFFADRLPPLVGGMEMHAHYFIKHFTNHKHFPLLGVITKNLEGQDCIIFKGNLKPVNLSDLANSIRPTFVFFNSGRWIEELKYIRKLFSEAIFIYRTGGNEILKAPLDDNYTLDYPMRQKYWVSTLNNSIDLMITNSAYTENRLENLGVSCAFARCVGGANLDALHVSLAKHNNFITIFCGARFVPYKNHWLLVTVVSNLIKKGHNIKLRLAGDGPLLSHIKKQVLEEGIDSCVEFLGSLSNEQNCKEIAEADIYMQFSSDYVTDVPGGFYIHSEGMGRSILEAITAGTFVIAGNSGALPEIVTEERGMLVELNDTQDITNQVDHILKNPPIKLAYCYDYSWERLFNYYERIFEGYA